MWEKVKGWVQNHAKWRSQVFFFFFAKVPEILHVIFNWIETRHPVFFLAVLLFVFEILRMQNNLCFLSRQHVTPKTVISLKIQQNIDLSQRAALTIVDFR